MGPLLRGPFVLVSPQKAGVRAFNLLSDFKTPLLFIKPKLRMFSSVLKRSTNITVFDTNSYHILGFYGRF